MFFHKEKARAPDVEDIKGAMIEEAPALLEPIPARERETGAPLFVKVDKYRDIIKNVQEIKLFVASTKQVFGILHDVESLRADTLNVLRATLQRIERSMLEIDTELLRPYGASVAEAESGEAGHIESSLGELQRQLLELKRELQEMK